MSYHTAHPGPNPLQETPQQYGHHQQQLPHQPQYHHDAQYTVNTLPPQQAAVYGVPQYTPVQTIPADPSAYQVSPLSHGHHSQRRASEKNAPDRGEVSGGAGFFTQLCATIRRQLIQKRRMWGSFLLEVLLPALFMLGLLVISSVSGRTEYPPQSFTNVAGPLPMGEIIRQQMLCYNSTNPATHDDLKALLSPCDPSNYHICLPTSEEIPIEGFCLNSTWEAAMGQAVRFLNVEMDVEIPNYDEYVLWKWFAVTVIPAEDSIFADRLNQARQPGKIFVAPDNGITRSFTSYMNTTHRLFKHTFGGYFASRDDAMPFVKSISSEGKIWGLYEILADSPSYLKYSISMNTSAMNMLQSSRNEQAVGLGEKNYARYTVSGALTLQKTINDYHAINTVGSSDSDIFATGARSHLSITPMPLDDYVKDEFLMIAGQMAPFLLVLSFLYSVSQLAKRLVEEKEQRLREGTMIMGLSKSAFFSSWLLVYYVQMFITSLIMTIIAKAGITKQSNFFIIFFAFFLYSVATVNMAALLSTFFNKSKIAALLVPLLYFVFAIPAFAIPQTAGSGPFLSLSFLCPMPFSVSLNLIFSHEINNGLGWNMAGSTKDKPYNFGLCLFWFIFDFFLYGFLLVYFDNVLPKDWGTTLHPCYCCCCSCVKRDKVNKASNLQRQDLDAIDNPRNHLTHATTFGVLQDYPLTNRHSTVHINQLRKEFPGAHGKVNVAVNGMELRMFPDSITVFLGHNGAGKTTVMNMMTGMMSPTDGDVTIYGKSILTDMQEIRRDIGFCPQHNILWADLTCMEHLQYFARLKGYSGAEVDEEAIEMLRKVDLLDKKDVFSKNLSGGQKRKLSVAIAFMGKARLVLLDEPTAGMDVAARRHTWDVLKEMSKGRTILLTTHFMDEADLLGSRIAIMSKGTLHSYGTPMYLKNNLGSGYVMKVACTVPIADPMPILREIQRILPGASLKEAKGQELAIVLPKEGARSFPAAIRVLDSAHCKRAYNISSVSVSVSSLEDVFLAIAEHEEMEGKSQQELDEEHATVHSAFDALETVYTRLQQKHRAAAAGGQEDIEMGSATNNTKIPTMGATGSFGRQLRGMIMKRVNHGRRDYCALCLQIVAPLICILIAMALGEIGAPSPQRVYWDNEGLYKNDVDQTTATNNCPAINDYFDSDFVFVDRQALNSTPAFSGYLLDQFDNNGDRERMVSFSCNDTFGNNVLFSNVTGLASAPQALNQFYRAKLRAHTGNPGATIDAAQWPFPFTEREMSQIDTISAVLVALFILIPFTFIPSTYVAFIVRERECKSKHLQFVSGASYVAYWLANFIFDLVSYLVTVGIAFLIFGIFNQKWTIGTVDTGFGTFVLFIFYGLSAIGCAYLASFLFDNHSTAQTIIMMVNFIIGFLLVLLMFFLREIDSTADAAEVIRYFLLFIPPFALGDGLFALVMSSALSEVQGTKSAFSTEVAGWNMIYMALLSVVFLAITMFIDHPSRQKRREMLSFKATHTAPEVNDEDEDVARERAEVEKGQRPDDVVQVQGLRKEFDLGGGKQKVAVQNITFGVKAGEVFGFLGTNGAGKTTTMSMLTTEILPTCGHGRIGGYDIVQDSGNTRRLIGYCPQFDAIMDLLTPAEHLNLFAALRGVDETEEVVEALIKSCALEKYRDIPAGQLSGGNKRKLSVAMSLIGGPSIVFLDEPSAGMDPHARRQLWDVIIFVAKHSSVVLTTHHLEEVDVLAHRVGIMDAGLLKCLGSLEHLKLKFGSGFELTIQVSESGFKSATEFIANTYPSAVLVEARQQRILYTLPFDSTDLASLFETIQRATDDPSIGIVDYTVQQTSLEQVFMRISEMSDADNEHTSPAAALQEGTASVPITDSVNNRQHSAHAYTDSVFNRSSRNRRAQSVDVNNQTL